MAHTSHNRFVQEISDSLLGSLPAPDISTDANTGLPSWFDVTGLATATMGAACAEIAALSPEQSLSSIHLDPLHASLWFGLSLRPEGWELPPTWNAIAGIYETSDGWIRLHTNAPHHRRAALSVLECEETRPAVTKAVAAWNATQLETAVVAAGGAAAEMRTLDDWQSHPQGKAVSSEPLIAWNVREGDIRPLPANASALPLTGLKVLDCTRVLAGPSCTRFLAGYGANVLRIDPPDWVEGVVPEVSLGKRLATLDLKTADGRDTFVRLLGEADVFVHGYRPGALDRLGLSANERRAINPNLIEATLNAYGWTGPWSSRRGFDSLLQMSSGIADLGMMRSGSGKPTPLPAPALDYGAGFLMAASVVRALGA